MSRRASVSLAAIGRVNLPDCYGVKDPQDDAAEALEPSPLPWVSISVEFGLAWRLVGPS